MAGDAFAKNGQLWKLAKSQGLNGYIVSSFLLDISASSEDLEPIVPPQEPSEQPSQPIISGTTEDRLERLEARNERYAWKKLEGKINDRYYKYSILGWNCYCERRFGPCYL